MNTCRGPVLTLRTQLGFPTLPESKPEGEALNNDQTLKDLHRLLLETQVMEGKLICGNCGHEYVIKEGIANFLLPSHLGKSYPPPVFESAVGAGTYFFWFAV